VARTDQIGFSNIVISSQRLLENARNDSRAMAGQNSDRSLKDLHNTRLFLLNDRR